MDRDVKGADDCNGNLNTVIFAFGKEEGMVANKLELLPPWEKKFELPVLS